MRKRQERNDPGAKRVTEYIGMRQLQMVEQRAHVLCHCGAVIRAGIVELGGFPVTAIIQRDNTPAGCGQRAYPSGIDPVHGLVGSKSVHEDDWRPLAFVEERDLHVAM